MEMEINLIGDREKRLLDAYKAIFGEVTADDLVLGARILSGEVFFNPYAVEEVKK
jgi:hypothetical protein